MSDPGGRDLAPEIVVVGSLNMDIRLTVDRIPHSGETISATGLKRSPGGKGGNQAVAAARLGRRVAMVGAVGDDDAGREIADRLGAEGLTTRAVAQLTDVPTGTAVILWEQPESTIVIEAGANARVDEAYVREHADTVRYARIVLCQCETPLGALAAVVDLAQGVKILNPAPAVAVPREIRDGFNILVPNRFELATLANANTVPRTLEGVVALAKSLEFPGSVVVTLGEDGSVVIPNGGRDAVHVPAIPVNAIDTTAAGDSFCAALADGLLRGEDLVGAARWAARVAAVTTTKHGAIESLPYPTDIPNPTLL
ncbi:ribokinase [Sanguibacter gelidistatuariae]|uniref:Ribokinase n=1 Tax=Sanguibacter gelidistatuariae TaxID=1814289 RepID=A0A1G6XLD2_9MICO|nr:ribokinase [Sanguibacter gelidistatuariae]SDD78842.1 ribokinase [Sanguibacter gelidistatuariae]